MSLGALRWTELDDAARVLAVPLGATEQHGPHLPLRTDTAIAEALCARLARRLPEVVVGPAVPYGASGEHAAFPGTLSIGHEALWLLLVELVRSADRFTGVVLVNGHGGNLPTVHRAAEQLRGEGRRVLAWCPDGPADDSHAGRTETSAMLHLHPGEVTLPDAAAGCTEPLPRIIDRLRGGGVRAVSPNGVLGDPAGATAAEGAVLLARWTEALTTAVTRWLIG
ncbi:mycofactocin biosynthesis peptidyl-dipeptidase MftE [Saccharopolyspora sp. 6V]|uniref:mycofactocin biosynthesis peptidyl-dipeptidase MftE n=1 Tax=Saccharopolyspora sp. 6V TaxID=2877239 RepID=UPI001CD50466|nr:mycofactocin biosynthesis peptidyl-dipeptidase MftE [Saccharopolyspora sp. 6V]MCA1194223.1 mycofactocin biosynthesis peptidyl-dipeptidase MftE [Saccharopolyspora sp. 6V]